MKRNSVTSARVRLHAFLCALCVLCGADPAPHKEMEITGLTKDTAAFFANAHSKITTYKGAIYCTYLDSDRDIRVRKKGADGIESDARVFGPVARDPWHMAPVLGIDGNGYVHITAGMHDAREWHYYISAAPGSIDRFTKQEHGSPRCPPGWLITYPEFAHDNRGTLYLSSRQGTKNPGHLGASVARYDHTAGTWQSLGTDIDRWNYLIWFQKGPNEVRCYQKWDAQLHFDYANTLHLAWKVSAIGPKRNYNTGTHIMAARLPDGASQWETVDRKPILDLPLTIKNASVVATDFKRPELILYGLGATTDGSPVVNYRYSLGDTPGGGDKGWIVKWTGKDWKRLRFPREIVIPTYLMSDNKGKLFTYGPGGSLAYLSRDDGESWEVVTMPYDRGPAFSHSFDRQHFIATGNPRLAVFFDKAGVIEVWTIECP
ncbi:MAG: hypothetical protein HN742_39725 [Lentisphaerae bacterium]|jgi:hypothetical protein|nr:hypothetical protein [Lentisphaerota bacterium]MBT4814255.1 hypothetical protein [Lentisphaerota bacterium]MBT5610969.1 hypothetical protein [Lentisphaerota bacterium]MBT7058062.1 hypothetical protein [Lentisphaerota bacterium]MBT7848065.1 hypothetical protein [Lentisphaerota bacterium]